MRNEQGMTLIESLAAITILSIIGGILWNVYFSGIEYSKSAVSQTMLQQEANTIITSLTKIHQTSESYEIKNENGVIEIISTNPSKTIVYEHSKINYSIDLGGHPQQIQPNEGSIAVTITLSDKNPDVRKREEIKVETILHRL